MQGKVKNQNNWKAKKKKQKKPTGKNFSKAAAYEAPRKAIWPHF